MFRKFLSVLVSFLIVFSFAGCSDADIKENTSLTSSEESAPISDCSEQESSEIESSEGFYENESSDNEKNESADEQTPENDDTEFLLDGAELMFKMNYGLEIGDIKIGFEYSQDPPLNIFVGDVPEHFIVKKNKNVAVLDSSNFSIIEYKNRVAYYSDGSTKDYIDNKSPYSQQKYLYFGSLNNYCDRPIMFCEADDGYVVAVKNMYYEYNFTEPAEKVVELYFVYVSEGGFPKYFAVPDESELSYSKLAEMYFEDGKLFVSTQNSLYFEIDTNRDSGMAKINEDLSHEVQYDKESVKFESRDGNVITVPIIKDADFVTQNNIGYDKDGNIYVFHNWRERTLDVVFNTRISKYDREGNEIGFWLLEDCYLEKVIGSPYCSAFVTPNGEVYFIRFYEKCACVYKLELETP